MSTVDDPVFDISNDYSSNKKPFNVDSSSSTSSIYDFDVRLDSNEYNIYVIFISILLLLWFLRSLRKFFRMLRVRTSLRGGTLVFIRAIGSSLRIFDGVTYSHSSSILNTRQANPPSLVLSLVMPISIKDIKLVSNKVFSMELVTSVPVVVWVVSNFHTTTYKDVYQNKHSSTSSNSNSNNNSNTKDVISIIDELNRVRRSSSSLSSELHGSDDNDSSSSSSSSSSRVIINTLGYHNITLNLPKTTSNTTYSSTSNATSASNDTNDIEKGLELTTRNTDSCSSSSSSSSSTIAVFIFPLAQIEESICTIPSTNTTISSNKMNNNINATTTTTTNTITNTTTDDISRKSISSSPPYSIINNTNFTRFDYAIQTITYDSIMKVMTPSDLLVFDTSKVMYSAMEIYGGNTTLKSTSNTINNTSNYSNNNISSSSSINDDIMISNPLANNTIDKSSTTTITSNNNNNGNISSDECVVCLTESVQVVLIPCRHMCVCAECLVHIDKCPTCRAPFEQHLKIHKEFSLKNNNTRSNYKSNTL